MDQPQVKIQPRQILVDWLSQVLRSGRVKASDIHRAALSSGHNRATLMRAKAQLGIISERDGFGEGGVWYWRLPADSDKV